MCIAYMPFVSFIFGRRKKWINTRTHTHTHRLTDWQKLRFLFSCAKTSESYGGTAKTKCSNKMNYARWFVIFNDSFVDCFQEIHVLASDTPCHRHLSRIVSVCFVSLCVRACALQLLVVWFLFRHVIVLCCTEFYLSLPRSSLYHRTEKKGILNFWIELK